MFKKLFQPIRKGKGFTLVEMIGVLAIIAILIALLLPKVFALIASTNARSMAAALRTYETAIVNYYADIGSVYPLNVAGTPAAEGGGLSTTPTSLASRLTLDVTDPLNVGTGSWPRFRGPYAEKFNSDVPPGLGTRMRLMTGTGVGIGVAATANNRAYDLKGDDGNNDMPTGSRLAHMRVEGVSDTEFNELDGIIDAGIGTNLTERQLRGRVKYNPANDQVYIYMQHQ